MAERKKLIDRNRTFKWDSKAIREARMLASLTQGQMSKEFGVPQQRISEWELGVHAPGPAMSALLDIYFEKRDLKL